MPLHPTSQFLVDAIEALVTLDGRFEQMKLVNYNSVVDQRRGCFSLVFRARDKTTDTDVALKFFDPQGMMDTYRLEAFRREHQILEGLLGVPGCLQLAAGRTTYNLPLTVATGGTVPFPCEYFAIEWIDEEIDGYFLCQQQYSAQEKLRLFAKIVSAVATLHAHEVFHRDLKPDNMRLLRNGGQPAVVAIDLGTAARYTSPQIAAGYTYQVGHLFYASPESQCGLAGNRRVAPRTDVYALGCMLFELFNKDSYFNALLTKNPGYPAMLLAMRTGVRPTTSDRQQEDDWIRTLAALGNSLVPVAVNGAGSDIPPGIAGLVNEILFALTNIDYRRRPQLQWIHARLRSALAVLANEKACRRRIKQAQDARANRIEKIKRRENRLRQSLANRNHIEG
ncbi:protein kinase [Ramlibacter sp. G-1-2-2]|uniref:Protein kinase n=1 Tax=Ramlibacter agri TaxID=2728837 RepID=A0A848GYE8_9BURK|nr:protein kinase [Ramlibacter agri]NML43187.1 protein kinase [Ramlibacter agri]